MLKAASTILAVLIMAAGAVASSTANGASTARRFHVGSPAAIIRLAERGNALAQAKVGFMYEYGRGLPQDFILAAKWYSRAAEQGEPHGQHFLGLLYDKGRGVPEDAIESYKWLNLAAARAERRDRDYYIRMRDAIASKMDRYAIAEGQRRARAWRPVSERW
jgi:TPR repeat protein